MTSQTARVFRVIVLVLCLLAPGTAPAHADSILNYWFPSIFGPPDKGPKPQDTLIAPFAQNQTGPVRKLSADEQKVLSSPENQVPITQPHRSNKYISDWISNVATETFTFDSLTFDDHMKSLDKYFIPYGKQEFLNYLTQTNTLASMTSQRQKMQAYTKTVPTLLNEGEYNGSYRWLFDVPVVVTIMPSNTTSYSGKMAPQTYTQNLIVRVQLGRAKDGFAEGMAVERWTVAGAPAQ